MFKTIKDKIREFLKLNQKRKNLIKKLEAQWKYDTKRRLDWNFKKNPKVQILGVTVFFCALIHFSVVLEISPVYRLLLSKLSVLVIIISYIYFFHIVRYRWLLKRTYRRIKNKNLAKFTKRIIILKMDISYFFISLVCFAIIDLFITDSKYTKEILQRIKIHTKDILQRTKIFFRYYKIEFMKKYYHFRMLKKRYDTAQKKKKNQ